MNSSAHVMETAENTDEYVHLNPWTAIGIAAAAGAAITILLGTWIKR